MLVTVLGSVNCPDWCRDENIEDAMLVMLVGILTLVSLVQLKVGPHT